MSVSHGESLNFFVLVKYKYIKIYNKSIIKSEWGQGEFTRKDPKTQEMGQHIGEFFKNVSKYRKIVGGLDKEKWYELDHFVAQLLEWCK